MRLCRISHKYNKSYNCVAKIVLIFKNSRLGLVTNKLMPSFVCESSKWTLLFSECFSQKLGQCRAWVDWLNYFFPIRVGMLWQLDVKHSPIAHHLAYSLLRKFNTLGRQFIILLTKHTGVPQKEMLSLNFYPVLKCFQTETTDSDGLTEPSPLPKTAVNLWMVLDGTQWKSLNIN